MNEEKNERGNAPRGLTQELLGGFNDQVQRVKRDAA